MSGTAPESVFAIDADGAGPASGGVLPCPVGSVLGPTEAIGPSLPVRKTNYVRLRGQMTTINSKILDLKSDGLVVSNGVEVMGRRHRRCKVMTLAERCTRAAAAAQAIMEWQCF